MLEENEQFKIVQARYAHIARRIQELWGRPALSSYINHLLQDTRGGTRQGFPGDVAMAMFKLMNQHDDEYPQYAIKAGDIWS